MKHGLAVFPTAEGLPPGELARLAEDRGFESLFFPEHSHMPLEYEAPSWDPSGEAVGPEYARVLDPFVALTAAAAATTRLVLGTGVCLLAQRDPIQTAKTVATLDLVSGGRLVLGVAPGWNREEMANHGYDFRTRFSRLAEAVAAMKEIWSQEVASFHGRNFAFDRIESWPKPVQDPHPPILLGGAGPTVLDRVLECADGWLAEPEPDLGTRIAELTARSSEAGRRVQVTVYGAEPGDAATWEAAGADRCVYWLTPSDTDRQRQEVDDVADTLS